MSSSHFRAKGVGKKNEDGDWLFRNIDLEVKHGILTITGPSGVGKSTLLKCINQTIIMDEGQVYLEDKTPDQWGMPNWRSRVMYIPQRSPIMEGTPSDFVEEVRRFGAHKKNKESFDDPVEIGLDWGIRPELWHSRWNTLSGGEIQRISLAIGCSFRPDVLLLDEPTSALDESSCGQVERTLRQMNCVCLWVTHNPQQAHRISSAGTLVMRGGDNREPQSPSAVVVEDGHEEHHHANSQSNGTQSHGNGGQNGNSSSRDRGTLTSFGSSTSNSTDSSKATRVGGRQ
ncbi:hypothetical protein EMPS_00800 [Entomortierella parvispora]|uniref:ABC transporter domain-containing protein n=1 Tax=Entomortierella parvispora TaxID=205924 RepID=A0A9P3LS31_9FUNG|nr:hypothetical protein EMPS_00800 [Entomortierella parvispora]